MTFLFERKANYSFPNKKMGLTPLPNSSNIERVMIPESSKELYVKSMLNFVSLTLSYAGDTRYWGSPKPKAEPKNDRFFSPYYQAKSDDIEQTAYGLMARIPEGSVSAAVGNVDIVRWLSAQRNSLGGWASTQVCFFVIHHLAGGSKYSAVALHFLLSCANLYDFTISNPPAITLLLSLGLPIALFP